MNKKISFEIFIIVTLIITIFIGLLFWLSNKQKINQNQSIISIKQKDSQTQPLKTIPAPPGYKTSSEQLTENWDIYTNEKYGIEFKYPTGYNISNNENVLNINSGSSAYRDSCSSMDGSTGWKMKIYSNRGKLDLKDWYERTFNKNNNKKKCADSLSAVCAYPVAEKWDRILCTHLAECEQGDYFMSPDKSEVVAIDYGQNGPCAYAFYILTTFKFTK
jgi:hypothetical protein